MPYAPGVQDITGQLRAAGIAQAGQAWSQAIGNIGKDVADAMQTYKQNQFMTNQALGKFAAASNADQSILKFLESGGQQEDPNAPKVNVSPELLKAYANVKSGKIDVYDAGLLSAFTDTWAKTKEQAQQVLNNQLKNQLLQGQINQQKRIEDFLKSIPPEGQQAQQQQMEQPSAAIAAPQAVAQPSYGVSTPSPNAAVPSMLSRFVAPPATQQPQLAAFLPQPGQEGGRPSSAPTRQDYAEATLENPMGNPTIWARAAAKKAEDRQKAYMSESVFTGPEGLQKAQAKSDEKNRSGDVPEGLMWAPKFSESAKGFYPELREKPKTREEQAALAQEITKRQKLAEAAIEDAKTFLGDINASAAQAIDDKARFDRIRQLYSKKAESGKIADWTLDARSALAEVGLGDRAKTAGEQELRGLLALSALQASKQYYKGQGSTSNEERNRIDQVVSAYNKGQVTNEALIQFAEAHNRKLVKASQLDLALTKQKIPLDDRGIKLREWWLANPVDKFMGDGTTETYELNDQGIMVKAPAAQSSAAAPSAQAGTPTQQPISIGRFKVIQVNK